ncbi:hypothetical protein BCT21_09650 [Vibrio sp. 10N.222.55.F9]|nr:hypothetical protein BCU05_02280 [Vibrio sp. 10N.261.54.C3]PMO00798.1 hypothetical protein BCT21_09650 [Vibrio sp. 10N.222.55.F9]PMO02628.1 hypothetical protein BCT20_10455 [Vibrio sp. 10N.222.55.C12]PMO11770.1 hypothetical protein BCT17_16415 [Vibrio sp. 10N.222.54.F10]
MLLIERIRHDLLPHNNVLAIKKPPIMGGFKKVLKSRIDGLVSILAYEQYLVFSQYYYVLSQYWLASFSLLSDKLPRIIRFQFVSASDYIKLLFTFIIVY